MSAREQMAFFIKLLTLLHLKVLLVSPGMAAAKPFSQGV
jgi:hypothetical protein